MKFGEYLKKLREANGLSQSELADKVGIPQNYVSRFENGTDPNWETACKIATALNVSLDVFRGKEAVPKIEVPEVKKLRIVVSLADTDITILDVERKLPR